MDRRITHGHTRKGFERPEYSTWENMNQRCRNRNSPNWKSYGGRGIRVCARWKSFSNFLNDVGPKPGLEYSLDRIDNEGDYEPGNVRWATKKEQSRNRRDNNVIVFKGQARCVQDWSVRTGLGASTIRGRLARGWSVEDALTRSARSPERVISFRGRVRNLSEWADHLGIGLAAMGTRLRRWPLERALTEKPNAVKVQAGRQANPKGRRSV